MSWGEFVTLLGGLMDNTPLGKVISIRSENNKDILKNFTKEQHRIRNEWRSRYISKIITVSKEDAARQVQMFQEMCKAAFKK